MVSYLMWLNKNRKYYVIVLTFDKINIEYAGNRNTINFNNFTKKEMF